MGALVIDVDDVGDEGGKKVMLGQRCFGFRVVISTLLRVGKRASTEPADQVGAEGPKDTFDTRPEFWIAGRRVMQARKQTSNDNFEDFRNESRALVRGDDLGSPRLVPSGAASELNRNIRFIYGNRFQTPNGRFRGG
ncbi:hypothetical protein QCN27_19310 [Cereibacter sp. SYSU M97828]|nr:hypothetical protein [Cereibacter flavus]